MASSMTSERASKESSNWTSLVSLNIPKVSIPFISSMKLSTVSFLISKRLKSVPDQEHRSTPVVQSGFSKISVGHYNKHTGSTSTLSSIGKQKGSKKSWLISNETTSLFPSLITPSMETNTVLISAGLKTTQRLPTTGVVTTHGILRKITTTSHGVKGWNSSNDRKTSMSEERKQNTLTVLQRIEETKYYTTEAKENVKTVFSTSFSDIKKGTISINRVKASHRFNERNVLADDIGSYNQTNKVTSLLRPSYTTPLLSSSNRYRVKDIESNAPTIDAMSLFTTDTISSSRENMRHQIVPLNKSMTEAAHRKNTSPNIASTSSTINLPVLKKDDVSHQTTPSLYSLVSKIQPFRASDFKNKSGVPNYSTTKNMNVTLDGIIPTRYEVNSIKSREQNERYQKTYINYPINSSMFKKIDLRSQINATTLNKINNNIGYSNNINHSIKNNISNSIDYKNIKNINNTMKNNISNNIDYKNIKNINNTIKNNVSNNSNSMMNHTLLMQQTSRIQAGTLLASSIVGAGFIPGILIMGLCCRYLPEVCHKCEMAQYNTPPQEV